MFKYNFYSFENYPGPSFEKSGQQEPDPKESKSNSKPKHLKSTRCATKTISLKLIRPTVLVGFGQNRVTRPDAGPYYAP